MPRLRRRQFLKTSAVSAAAAFTSPMFTLRSFAEVNRSSPAGPIALASGNGPKALEKAMSLLHEGADALDAVIAGVNIVEDDPNDTSVGYGGLPNEDGVVELDAAVMHGASCRGGAVGALRNIKNPSRVARLVMERTDHVLLVGDGALKFAKAHGFQEENLLTDRAREEWLKWKEHLSNQDFWYPPHSIEQRDIGEFYGKYLRHYGTIHCSAIDKNGNISCVTTTSGRAFKLAGRVGDSPIIGAGLFCDNDVGAAGSTGRGEANLLNCSSVMIVEWMRQGKSPQEACVLACKRIVDHTKERRLLDEKGRFSQDVTFFAMNKAGEHGGASMWKGANYLVHDGKAVSKHQCAYLFESTSGG